MIDLTPARLAELRAVTERIPPLDSKWPDAAYIRLACTFTRERLVGLIDEITRLRAENDALAAALEPFAKYATILGEPFTGNEKVRVSFGEPLYAAKTAPNVGDCRRAADALAKRDAK